MDLGLGCWSTKVAPAELIVSALTSSPSPARLVVLLAGAVPARTVRMLPVKSILFVVVPTRFAGGRRRRGDGELGGGGVRLARGSVVYAGALHRSPSKHPPFPSSGGAAVLCLAQRADGDDRNAEKAGGAGAGGNEGVHRVGSGMEGAGAGVDHPNSTASPVRSYHTCRLLPLFFVPTMEARRRVAMRAAEAPTPASTL